MKSNSTWSEKELSLLTRFYPSTTNEDLAIIISTRTPHAIAHKAQRMGLKKSDAFLNSPKSGRFQPVVPFWKKILSYLRLSFIIELVELHSFRKTIQAGMWVTIHKGHMVDDVKVYGLTPDRKQVTVYNSKKMDYDVYKISDLYPSSIKE